jgi:hypothetical protein
VCSQDLRPVLSVGGGPTLARVLPAVLPVSTDAGWGDEMLRKGGQHILQEGLLQVGHSVASCYHGNVVIVFKLLLFLWRHFCTLILTSVVSLKNFEATVPFNEGHFRSSVRKEISMKSLDLDCKERDSHYIHTPRDHCCDARHILHPLWE